MKGLLTVTILLLLFSCAQTEKKSGGQWKTIEVGNYLFDFPPDFELVAGKGIDSYVGKIKGDSTWFDFDYGYYSNDFEQSPGEIKQLNITIDTVDNQYRKIVLAKDPQNGTTGIYMRALNGFNKSINSHLALSMSTSKLTIEQQETALKIFKTGRHKNETK